jgi:3-phosphoshikimate 1-carboxyvinyltransferase
MPAEIEILPVTGPLHATVQPPGSKSITNRALVCAALAAGTSTLRGALESEDTQVMIASLQKLGIEVEAQDEGETLVVHGCGGEIPVLEADLFVANSGTTMRFLTALVTLGKGGYRLSGIQRMHHRPIADLLDALRQLGVSVQSENSNGCPPVVVAGLGLAGGQAKISGSISSQFLSALMMACPGARSPVEIVVQGELVSKPYVEMTTAVMRSFGAKIQRSGLANFHIPAPQTYRAQDYAIEPDASAASYFFAAAAIAGGEITVTGLSRESLQGDVGFCECLAAMGCVVQYEANSITVRGIPAGQGSLRGVTLNMNAISDTVQTLAAVALFAEGPTKVVDIAHVRHKETDRIRDLATELRKLGATVTELPDGLEITPGPLHGARIETYNDHRMAMSLALVGLRIPGVVILDPACTAKTYPRFFEDLARLVQGKPV